MKDIAEVPEPHPPPPVSTVSIVAMETAELFEVVVGDRYIGSAWEELQRRLVLRAFPDL